MTRDYASEPLVSDWVIRTIKSEQNRGIPVQLQTTFDAAVEDFVAIQKAILREQSRKGGLATKTDALQTLITKIVTRNPHITVSALLDDLKGEAGEGVVTGVDGINDVLGGDTRQIRFENETGAVKTSPVSGLKDRLHRARARIARTG